MIGMCCRDGGGKMKWAESFLEDLGRKKKDSLEKKIKE